MRGVPLRAALSRLAAHLDVALVRDRWLVRWQPDSARRRHLRGALDALLLIAGVGALSWAGSHAELRALGFCLMDRLTSLPCPGCGMTTGCARLIHADWSGAWRANPAVFPLGMALALKTTGDVRGLLGRQEWAALAIVERSGRATALVTLAVVWIARFHH